MAGCRRRAARNEFLMKFLPKSKNWFLPCKKCELRQMMTRDWRWGGSIRKHVKKKHGEAVIALSDTQVFLLNEYFIELNTTNFNILNKVLNWILLENRKMNQLLNWILTTNWKWINFWIEFVGNNKKWIDIRIEFC